MTAYCGLQDREFASEKESGYEAVKHQRFVGTGYFDSVQQVITSGTASTTALAGSTENAQFSEQKTDPAAKEERRAAWSVSLGKRRPHGRR